MEDTTIFSNLQLDSLYQLANDMKADCVVTLKDQDSNGNWMEVDMLKEGEVDDVDEITYEIQVHKLDQEPIEYALTRKRVRHFDMVVSEIISDLIKKSYIAQNMKVLIATDRTIARRYNVAIMLIDVDRALYRIGKFGLAENMSSESVIESIIEMAQDIGAEGREGKKVGTLFVIGDPKELEQYTRQLILNPFAGYDKEFLNITSNDTLQETIKNFAQLDGAFIIDNEGNFLSAGTYLDIDTSHVKPYQGWGTKHLAATAITGATTSIAVLVSESGGIVKIFKNGKLILRIQ